MNRIPLLIFVLLGFFLAGCASGGQRVSVSSRQLSDGAREMKRGGGWYRKGCFSKALQAFSAAHELYVALDRQAEVALALDSMGNAHRKLGDSGGAILLYAEAMAIYGVLDETPGMCRVMVNKSAALMDERRLTEAEALLDRAEAMVGDCVSTRFLIMRNQGVLLTLKRDFEGASAALLKARMLTGPENPVQWGAINFALGNLMKETGRYDAAMEYFSTALRADRAAGDHMGIAGDLWALGEVCAARNTYGPATDFMKRSAQIYALMGDGERCEAALARLADYADKTGSDLRLTRHFIDRWSAGEIIQGPCEN